MVYWAGLKEVPMKKLFAVVCFLVLLGVCARGLGVRIHPEVLRDLSSQRTKEYYRLDLVNGKSLTGELIEKKGTGILFKWQGVPVSFTNSEIGRLTSLGNTPPAGEARDLQRRPWITFSPEDSLFSRSVPSAGEKAPAVSQGPSFLDSFTPSVPLNALARAKSQLKKAAETRAQNQNI